MTNQSAEKELTVTRTKEDGANEESSITFVPTTFARGKRKELGIKYPGLPKFSKETEPMFRTWFGDENYDSMVEEASRLWIQQVYNAVIEGTTKRNEKQEVVEAGYFDEKMFVDFAKALSTRGETKDEIETALATLRGQLVEVMGKAEAATDDAEKLSYMGEFLRIGKDVKKYDAILASKKRIPRAAKNTEEDGQ